LIKQNGGKADALNMGLNISDNKYVACIDVDLFEDAHKK
jgi:cellulose synthase/poly-beta-1,6-N-acetylglucosamine synthase-like glycosyltransferase